MNRSISLGIFLLVAIVAWWTITNKSGDNAQLQQPKSDQYVEIFMNEFEMTVMNETGSPDFILNGRHLQRYNDSTETAIQQPIFHLLQKDKQWVISADSATINDDDETIQLNNNVIMQQKNTQPAVTIRTQNLLINTKTQIAKTAAMVDVTQGGSHLNSTGMVFNNITSALELSSRVNGYYLPHD